MECCQEYSKLFIDLMWYNSILAIRLTNSGWGNPNLAHAYGTLKYAVCVLYSKSWTGWCVCRTSSFLFSNMLANLSSDAPPSRFTLSLSCAFMIVHHPAFHNPSFQKVLPFLDPHTRLPISLSAALNFHSTYRYIFFPPHPTFVHSSPPLSSAPSLVPLIFPDLRPLNLSPRPLLNTFPIRHSFLLLHSLSLVCLVVCLRQTVGEEETLCKDGNKENQVNGTREGNTSLS